MFPRYAVSAELAFRRHVINADSTYSACAVVDVNRDGKLDIVSGGWWYEAPAWKRHFLREVEMIRGRYDDYSNLPLDVNADGWMDLISVNYRSKKMYWFEHPGKSLGPWKTHLIAMPGSSETGRLVDVDGDGVVDLFPNGTSFAAWWELVREKDRSSNTQFRWVRRALPEEVAAHGIGFGDIDGDGRKDIVTPHGWFRAPENRRNVSAFVLVCYLSLDEHHQPTRKRVVMMMMATSNLRGHGGATLPPFTRQAQKT